MNKKIILASLFASLILLVPFSSVVGESNIELNKNNKKISTKAVISILKKLVIYISHRFSYDAELVSICYYILISINNNIFNILCSMLYFLLQYLLDPNNNIPELFWFIAIGIIGITMSYLCRDWEPPSKNFSVLDIRTILNKMQNCKIKCFCME